MLKYRRYEPLPVIIDPERASELDAPLLYLDEINSGFDRLARGSIVRQLVHFS